MVRGVLDDVFACCVPKLLPLFKRRDTLITRLHRYLCLLFLPLTLATALSTHANPAVIPDSASLAKTVEIADVHMHLVGQSVEFHREQMDRNNVKWGGGVGPTGSSWPKPSEMTQALGTRYFFALGQVEFSRVFFSVGPTGLVDPSSIAFVEMFAFADQMLSKREAYGFGELHIDNSKSFSTHQFARKIQFDNPVARKMFELANKHGAVLQFHMQGDDSANNEELSKYLNEFPNAKVVLSHLMPWSKQLLLRELLSKHKNLYMELSAKGSVLGAREAAQVFNRNGPKAYRLDLIEEFPDRFMLGSDTHAPNENKYDDVISEIREGLLPYLRPDTLKKVAYQNAVTVFGLK